MIIANTTIPNYVHYTFVYCRLIVHNKIITPSLPLLLIDLFEKIFVKPGSKSSANSGGGGGNRSDGYRDNNIFDYDQFGRIFLSNFVQ
ncbi:hypothetical protein DERP_010449 [Dermatophagoides pteronyssinus]|uniref:Uncharacterized protein n=1 Tax=Dermatophagoides pteronyssinus TaxID=6956 RepID=A0ABQ8J516_DERPT|nr:hypothetical protein DERP_010449 [Dermatophagoides pteronyssinus]